MRWRKALLVLGYIGLIAGCDQFGGFDAAESDFASPLVPSEFDTASPESLEMANYYTKVQEGHLVRGLLRTDGGGLDTPFDGDRLARTFEAVAFSREFSDVRGALVRRQDQSMLHRWETPIRIQTIIDPTVPDAQATDDAASIQRFSNRLERATRHPISTVDRGGNFFVLVVNEDQRRAIGPTLTRMIPEIRQNEIDVVQNLDRASYCLVMTSDPKNDGVIKRAVAIIRAELPPLLRLSCIHEEIAQGLGLSNDSPNARPSIFNDDDEFGRLTAMDELMLQMLYDPRLQPGMDAETARPTVNAIAAELTAPNI